MKLGRSLALEILVLRCEIQELGYWKEAKLPLGSIGCSLAIVLEFVYPYPGAVVIQSSHLTK